MGKSPNSSDRADRPDRRKHNAPPEHGKIKPGEVRNRWGRAGKPHPQPPTTMDELLWQEANQIVSHDKDGPVDAKKRLIQEDFAAAFLDKNSVVRARLLAQLHETSARIEQERRELLESFYEAKARLTEEFYFARLSGKTPPDVLPHPDHVEIVEGRVLFPGPTDRPGRAAWEMIKSALRITACVHEIFRAEYRRTGSPIVHYQLKGTEKHRRWLMRRVPKGWNWREEIYCRNSNLEFTKDLVRRLTETGYVAPTNLD